MPEVQPHVYHAASYHNKKRYCLPQVGFLDIEPCKEVVGTARGKPSMLQLTIQPAYCLTIHKVQALTIRHDVNGCLEGMFALGQLYVLWSRVADPRLFQAVGLPPQICLTKLLLCGAKQGCMSTLGLPNRCP